MRNDEGRFSRRHKAAGTGCIRIFTMLTMLTMQPWC
jgi:hypothetical protein